MATLAAATSLSLPPAPPAQLLDIQSLPSLEKFDSQVCQTAAAVQVEHAAVLGISNRLTAVALAEVLFVCSVHGCGCTLWCSAAQEHAGTTMRSAWGACKP